MPIFEPAPHFVEGEGAFSRRTSTYGVRRWPNHRPTPISRDRRLFLHRRTAVVRADADRRQQPGGRHNAAESPHRRVPGPHCRPARLRLFRWNAGGNARCARDHSARRPHQGLYGLCVAGGRFRDPDAGHGFPMGLARLSRAHRLRVRGPLRGDRGLDQRESDQLESRRSLCAVSNRELRRLRERTISAETPRSGRLFPLRRRRRAARARDRSDGDDERRSARSAAQRASPPPLAHSHGADSVFRRAGRGRRERRPVRARARFSP